MVATSQDGVGHVGIVSGGFRSRCVQAASVHGYPDDVGIPQGGVARMVWQQGWCGNIYTYLWKQIQYVYIYIYICIYVYVYIYICTCIYDVPHPFTLSGGRREDDDGGQRAANAPLILAVADTHTHTHTHADTHVNQLGFRTKVHLLSSHFPPVRWTA